MAPNHSPIKRPRSSINPIRGWLLPVTYHCTSCGSDVDLPEILPGHLAVASPAVPAATVFHRCGTLLFSQVYSHEWTAAFAR